MLYHTTKECQAVLEHGKGNLILLHSQSKRPVLDDWVSGKSSINGDGRAYFDLGYNLGFRIPESHLVIDVDPRNGGWEDYSQLPEDVRGLPATTITAGGGIHIYTLLPEGYDHRTLYTKMPNKKWPGLDFLHYGKQVVLPGSTLNEILGWRVGPAAVFPPPATPQSLLDLLERKAPEKKLVDLKSYLTNFELDSILAMIPVSKYQDNDSWLQLAMACHHASGGEGLPAFLTWSTADPMYADQSEVITRRWESMDTGNSPAPVTVRTLMKELARHGQVPSWLVARAGMSTSPKDFFGILEEKIDPARETFEMFAQQIEASPSHMTLLTTTSARIGMESKLSESMKDILLKKISVKTGASVNSIRRDMKMMSTPKFQTMDGEEPEVPGDVTELSQPHTAAAQTAIVALSDNDVPPAYCFGEWLRWNGKCWERGGTDVEVKRAAHKALYNQGTSVTGSAIGSVVEVMRTLMEVPPRAFEPDVESVVIHTPFNTLRYGKKGWAVSRPSPENRNMSYIHAKYDPDAAPPALWLRFLNEVTTSEAARRTIACAIIYSAAQCRPWLRKAIYLYGPKRSGKSTLLNTIQSLLGANNCAALNMRQLGGRFGGSSLIAKLANISNETVSKDTIQDDIFKTLVSGEALEVEKKFKAAFVFHNTAKLWFAANGFPKVSDESDATWDRLTLISCPYTVPAENGDTMMGEKLKGDLSGILNWAMAIFHEEYQRDTCISAMGMDSDARHLMVKWQQTNNPSLRWAKERLAYIEDSIVEVDTAYYDYRIWCRENGHRELNKIHFSRQVGREFLRLRGAFQNARLRPAGRLNFKILD